MTGQNQWFIKLYQEHSARLFKQAFYVLRDRHLAEDLVEETFLILLYKQESLVSHPNIGGWLSQTLKNLIMDETKSARYRLEMPLVYDEAGATVDTYYEPLEDLLPRGLSPKEREILVLLYEKQMPYEDIAHHLGISFLNCRTRAFRAKAHYKELIESERNTT